MELDNLGGGEMSLMRGKIFEKAGVNISTVFGELSKQMKVKFQEQKIKRFLGLRYISVIHPFSPKSSSNSYEY